MNWQADGLTPIQTGHACGPFPSLGGYCPSQCPAALVPGRWLSAVRRLRGGIPTPIISVSFQARSFTTDRPRGPLMPSRRAPGGIRMRRESSPIKRRKPFGARCSGSPLHAPRWQAPHRQAGLKSRQGHLRALGRRPARDRGSVLAQRRSRHLGEYAKTWTSIIRCRSAPTRQTTTASAVLSTCRSRA